MFNLSLTACSLYLKKTNSRGSAKAYELNSPISLPIKTGIEKLFSNMREPFICFFKEYKSLVKDDDRQQSFRCEFEETFCEESNDFYMFYVRIYSGQYGSSSDIIDGDTKKVKFKKSPTDIEDRPFYLFIIFPKDTDEIKVQKGMFIFQNVGPYGIKTITTDLMQDYFSSAFGITLKCQTIAPELFVKKVIRKDNIRKLVMVKNMKSWDAADNVGKGYGSEVREIGNLSFNENLWNRIMERIRYVAGGRFNLFEFEQVQYDTLKVVVDIGGRYRKIDLHNLDNLSIIEGIPDEIKMADGHPNKEMLIEYFKKVATEYLSEMVLQVNL